MNYNKIDQYMKEHDFLKADQKKCMTISNSTTEQPQKHINLYMDIWQEERLFYKRKTE